MSGPSHKSAPGRNHAPLQYLDMGIVSDPAVRSALSALQPDARMTLRWSGINPQTLSLHREILQCYLQTGAPPAGLHHDDPRILDLVRRDLVVMDGANIAAAYPFSTDATRHSTVINGIGIACVCAIDALGSGAMVGAAALVTSRCPTCEHDVRIALAPDGLSLRSTAPESAVVWAGVMEVSGCAATSQCQSMLMFCSPEHLSQWQTRPGSDPHGFAFTVDQALQVGAAIFRPFMPAGR